MLVFRLVIDDEFLGVEQSKQEFLYAFDDVCRLAHVVVRHLHLLLRGVTAYCAQESFDDEFLGAFG